MPHTIKALTLLAVMATGCLDPGPEPIPCRNPEVGTVEIGGGDELTGFVQLDEGGEVKLVFGSGQMKWVAVGLLFTGFEHPSKNLPNSNASVALYRRVLNDFGNDDEENVCGGFESVNVAPAAGPAEIFIRCLIGLRDPLELVDEQYWVQADASDACGREIEASKKVQEGNRDSRILAAPPDR